MASRPADPSATRPRPRPDALAYSLRRQFVDEFYGRWVAGLAGRQRLLDLGGTRLRKRGCFDIEQYDQRVVYLNLVADKRPDVLGDAARLPFAADSFGVVICAEVLEHVPDPRPVLMEAARVLCDGGTLLATVPFLYQVHADPHDFGRYTAHYWRRMLDEVGLVEVAIEAQGRYWSVLTDQVRAGLAASRWTHLPPWRAACRALVALLRRAAVRLDSRPGVASHPVLGGFTTGYGLVARKGGPRLS